jgi:hypothetical protein
MLLKQNSHDIEFNELEPNTPLRFVTYFYNLKIRLSIDKISRKVNKKYSLIKVQMC